MKLLPQIRLQTLFAVILCTAVGLTIGTRPNVEPDPWGIPGWADLRLDWHYAVLAAVSVAMILGLVRQIRALGAKAEHSRNEGVYFARSFAIGWRLAMGTVIVGCLISTLLLTRELVSLPESETFFVYEVFPYAIWLVCMAIVLMASARQWRPRTATPSESAIRTAVVVILSFIYFILVLPDIAMVQYLVHIAIQGIEKAHPLIFQRSGGFPDQRAEEFRLFWISFCAVGLCVPAIVALLAANRRNSKPFVRYVSVVSFAASIAGLAGYVVWYYASEFQRVSPDLAGAGIAASYVELAAGAAMAVILTTASAYRLATSSETGQGASLGESDNRDFVSAHESTMCLLLLIGTAAVYFFEVIRAYSTFPFMFSGKSQTARVVETTASLLRNPSSMLMIVLCALSLRLLWLRWRGKSRVAEWNLTPLSRTRFLWNWVALVLLVAVAVPALSSFCFVMWLGPWYIYGP